MRRQGLQGRKLKQSKGLTRQDMKAAKFPDLLKHDFGASAPNRKWCGDITEIPTDGGKLYFGAGSVRASVVGLSDVGAPGR
jgi:transposase InsO family protein